MACNEYDPAENLKKKPSKSILKSSSSFETADRRQGKKSLAEKAKNAKWDEMNIIATLHPADKDYGHMKIDEPKTPFERTTEDETDSLDVDLLAEKIAKGSSVPAKILRRCSETETSDDDEEETPEQKAHRKLFDSKRKAHYNEFYAAKMARQLMEEEDEDDESGEAGCNIGTNDTENDEDGTAPSESGPNISSTE